MERIKACRLIEAPLKKYCPKRGSFMLHIQDYILFIVLIIALITDIKYKKIPNWLTVGALAVGIISHLITGGIDGLIFSFYGLLVASAIFIFLHIFKAIGAGDVKLFVAIGSLVGMRMVLDITMYAIIFAGVIGLVILLVTKTFLRNVASAIFSFVNAFLSKKLEPLEEFKVTKGTKFPFMYAVMPAVVVSYYYVLF